MLVNYMTEPVFQKVGILRFWSLNRVMGLCCFCIPYLIHLQGVRAYLKKFQYSNAKTADLWEALSAAADGKPIGKLMHSWTREMGYPVLTVRESTTADGKIAVRVKQERFLASGDVTPADDKVMWFVPLQMITNKALTVPSSDVLDIKEKVFELPGLVGATVSASDFYKLNYGHTGYSQHVDSSVLRAVLVLIYTFSHQLLPHKLR